MTRLITLVVLRGQLTNSPPTLVRAIRVYRALPDLTVGYPARLVLADQRQVARAPRQTRPEGVLLVAEYEADASIKGLARHHGPRDGVRCV